MDAATKTKLEVVPLTRHIGAEIRGIDLRDTLDAETIRAIHQAWLDHLVLVFRGQQFSQEALIRETGETIGALPDGEMNFHHDMIHAELPHNGTLLYSVEIPSYGGDTLFASGYAAYDTLDPTVRHRLEGPKALNHYNYGTTIRGDTSKAVEAFNEAVHPVFRTHDETGRKAIYVDRLMSVKVIDMPEADSDELLKAVFDHSEHAEFVYRHTWRVGDLLVWDNRCSAHARDDFPSDQRRLMWRTTVKGTVRPY